MDAPPPYDPRAAQAGPASTSDEPPPFDPSAAFVNLKLTPGPADPEPDTCLAHLKLLFAFQNLKEDVGYTDGLWGLWDTRAEGHMMVTDEGEVVESIEVNSNLKDDKQRLLILSKIREKRWAIFVARAVDRYEAWWNSLTEGPRLTEGDMDIPNSPAYADFPKGHDFEYWKTRTLPPLGKPLIPFLRMFIMLTPLKDVLMVYHSHMLNPYNFLEDCLRAGYGRLWRSGMPWELVNSALDAGFNYNVTDEDKAHWVAQTGRSWENTDDPIIKSISCPVCSNDVPIPWTTCGLDEHPKTADFPGLIGYGYGDGKLYTNCSSCTTRITKEFLSVAKFCKDARELLVNYSPMPGTIINPTDGEPAVFTPTRVLERNPQTFPNRMIQMVLRIQIQDLVSKPSPNSPPTMDHVRGYVEDAICQQKSLRAIEQPSRMRMLKLPPLSRLCVRKMMSRYWENFSPFALDLCGAVMRQGIFTEKMCKIDWLHSPTARDTMERLVKKYKRFLLIMSSFPSKIAVPTLDVDLAWHTHQLSPSAYYAYTKVVVKKFTRHDDKVDEGKLEEAFEWTSKTYQENYDEVYSECTCWYCESVRTSHISSIGRVLGISGNEKGMMRAFFPMTMDTTN
jgi:hypothetical protein